MKKIAFVISSLGSGGAERVVSILSNEFTKRGLEVSVVMVNNSNVYYEISEKIELVKLNCAQYDSLPLRKRFPKRIRLIKDTLIKINPDVVVSFLSEINIDVCLALRGSKIPVIVSERNDPATDPASRIKKILRKISYRKASGFVFQTEDAKKYFSKAIQRRSMVIFNPLSGNLPAPYDGEREKRIVAVGRLNRQKNYALLFKSFSNISSIHPEYTLDIYGEGVLLEELKSIANEMGLKEKIVFHGFCSDVHLKIFKAGMFVMSSDFEGMPNALIEAMAIGLPCISTDCPCGGPKTVIDNGKNGLLVPVNDSEALVCAMEKLISNTYYANEIGRAASGIRKELSVDMICDQWLKFIKERIGDK